MLQTLLLFLGSAIVIYLACELFVNGVEWLGCRLSLTQTATGTILAAFGAALPESVVTLVAVAFDPDPAAKDIGVGAALGGPLALSTLSYGVVGLTLLAAARLRRDKNAPTGGPTGVAVDGLRLSHDQGWFIVIFLFKIALGLVAFAGKGWLGLLFLAAYALYVGKELRSDGDRHDEDDLEPLKFRPRDGCPSLFWALLQTAVALTIVFIASRIFVAQLGPIGATLGLPPQLVALLLSPIATEMPETMNAIIWARQGKERLALANISGSMMIQATIPSAFGLFFTPWLFDSGLIWAAAITLFAIVRLFLIFRRGPANARQLARSSLLYLLFAGGLILL